MFLVVAILVVAVAAARMIAAFAPPGQRWKVVHTGATQMVPTRSDDSVSVAGGSSSRPQFFEAVAVNVEAERPSMTS
jgi:hypothetical protein